ncbi:MAG: hypothetical protein PHW04_15640 [Candidatus Wallbacteria bacterium]|nr:hypothetical protein [Candidatus Wallbacteria bacterium]
MNKNEPISINLAKATLKVTCIGGYEVITLREGPNKAILSKKFIHPAESFKKLLAEIDDYMREGQKKSILEKAGIVPDELKETTKRKYS